MIRFEGKHRESQEAVVGELLHHAGKREVEEQGEDAQGRERSTVSSDKTETQATSIGSNPNSTSANAVAPNPNSLHDLSGADQTKAKNGAISS